MASLSEMLQYAQAIDERKGSLANSIGNFGVAVGESISEYNTAKDKRKKEAVDRALKMLEIRDKQLKFEEDLRIQKFEEDKSKAAAVLPLNNDEMDIARGTAFAGMGGRTQAPRQNSQLERMMDFLNKADEIEFGKGGINFKVKRESGNRKRTAGQEDDLQKSIRKQASEMAKNELIQLSQAAGTYDVDISKPNVFIPTEELISKYYDTAERFLRGDKAGSETLRKKRLTSMEPSIMKLKEISAEIKKLETDTNFRGKIRNPDRYEQLIKEREQYLSGSSNPLGLNL